MIEHDLVNYIFLGKSSKMSVFRIFLKSRDFEHAKGSARQRRNVILRHVEQVQHVPTDKSFETNLLPFFSVATFDLAGTKKKKTSFFFPHHNHYNTCCYLAIKKNCQCRRASKLASRDPSAPHMGQMTKPVGGVRILMCIHVFERDAKCPRGCPEENIETLLRLLRVQRVRLPVAGKVGDNREKRKNMVLE